LLCRLSGLISQTDLSRLSRPTPANLSRLSRPTPANLSRLSQSDRIALTDRTGLIHPTHLMLVGHRQSVQTGQTDRVGLTPTHPMRAGHHLSDRIALTDRTGLMMDRSLNARTRQTDRAGLILANQL
jgi:hypothetical protein